MLSLAVLCAWLRRLSQLKRGLVPDRLESRDLDLQQGPHVTLPCLTCRWFDTVSGAAACVSWLFRYLRSRTGLPVYVLADAASLPFEPQWRT